MVKIPSVSWFVAYPQFVLMFEWTEWTCSKSLKLSRKVWSFMNSHSSSSLNVVLAVWLAAQTWRLHQARVNGQLASDPLFSAVTLTDWTTSVFFFQLAPVDCQSKFQNFMPLARAKVMNTGTSATSAPVHSASAATGRSFQTFQEGPTAVGKPSSTPGSSQAWERCF
jgi:hypothetical protein